MAALYAANPEKFKARAKAARAKNPEASRASSKRWKDAHPEARRAQNLKKNFGLTIEQYDALLLAQGGTCAICREVCGTGKRLAVDHDHETGEIRGLLCFDCNSGIGKLKDNRALLLRAAEYLTPR